MPRYWVPAISEAEEVPKEVGTVNPPWVAGYHKQTSAAVIKNKSRVIDLQSLKH
jgi:hypothetical protein